MSIFAQTDRSSAALLILAFIVFAIAVGLFLTLTAPAIPIYHDHAVEKHGPDALIIRNCQQRGPVLQIWEKSNGSNRYHCLFTMPDGRIGDQLVQLDEQNGVWHEITSFPRFEATLDDVAAALQREAKLIYPKP